MISAKRELKKVRPNPHRPQPFLMYISHTFSWSPYPKFPHIHQVSIQFHTILYYIYPQVVPSIFTSLYKEREEEMAVLNGTNAKLFSTPNCFLFFFFFFHLILLLSLLLPFSQLVVSYSSAVKFVPGFDGPLPFELVTGWGSSQ